MGDARNDLGGGGSGYGEGCASGGGVDGGSSDGRSNVQSIPMVILTEKEKKSMGTDSAEAAVERIRDAAACCWLK